MKYVILALAGAFLVGMAIHYPLATTWPIGGDAAVTIRDAKNISLATLTHSRYPLFPILFSITRLFPISWPERYIWMMAAGHLAAGLALAAWLYRVSGWRAAAGGMAIWALTITTVNNHFEDGTIAQLWSLPWLLLFFERITARSTWGSIVFFAATLLTHPLTGLLLVISLVLALPAFIKQKQWLLFGCTTMAALGILAMALWRPNLFRPLFLDSRSVSLPDLIRSFFGPFILLAPVGFLILMKRIRKQPVSLWLTTSWLLVIVLAIFSDRLSLHLAPARWQTYLVLAICAGSAVAWPRLVHVFPWRVLGILFTIALFTAIGAAAWRENSRVYAYYESPSRYARLHPAEQASIEWMATNLPTGSYIASSEANRHTEWIPVLTPLRWDPLSPQDDLWRLSGEALHQDALQSPYTHLLFFLKREKPNPQYLAHPDWFPIAFQNEGAVLFQLRP